MDNLITIGLSGKRGSGKGYACKVLQNYFAEKGHAVSVFKFSDILGKILEHTNTEKTQENYNALFLRLNKEKPDFMSAILDEKIHESIGVLIIDGVRDASQAEIVKRCRGYLIYIESEDHLRYQKVKERNEKLGDAGISFDVFKKDEEDPANINIESIKKVASAVLINNYTESFQLELETIAESLVA